MAKHTVSFLGNSAVPDYVKLCATSILSATYLSALTVATIDMLKYPDAQLPSIVTLIIGSGLSLALGVLGLHQGASLAEQQPGGGGNNAGTPSA